MNNTFFENQSAHQNIMYWWHGVIQDDKFWAGCTDSDVSNENSKLHFAKPLSSSPNKGWGKRYKVAIVGRHYAIKRSTGDSDWLEMAEVVYPVTAGNGLGGTKQTAALRHGAHVIGFYADGIEGRCPIILGCFGINEQNEPDIFKGDPPTFFQSRSGNDGLCGAKIKPIPEKDINLTGDKKPIEASESPLQASIDDKTKRLEGDVLDPMYKAFNCEVPGDIFDYMRILLKKLAFYASAAKGGVSDLTKNASNIIQSINNAISGLGVTLLEKMRGYIINKINNGVKDFMNFIPPFLRPNTNLKIEESITRLSCAFNKIKNKVSEIVKELTKQFINNYINAPLCAVTGFVGALMANIIGDIFSSINDSVNSINNALNKTIGDIANTALNIFDLALQIVEFFECRDEILECPETTQWSFWNGPKEIKSIVPEGPSRAGSEPGIVRTILTGGGPAKISQIVDGIIKDTGKVLPGSSEGSASNPCNSRQIPCGPPSIDFFGGGGSGAKANPIISVTGRIMGLDLKALGSEYTSPPKITVVDSCSTGGGAVIKAKMKPTGQFNDFGEELLELDGAVVLDSGSQYLNAPNGSTGGNGFILSNPTDIIHYKTGSTQIINGVEVNGTGFDVYPIGASFRVVEGDELYIPPNVTALEYDDSGNLINEVLGGSQSGEFSVRFSGIVSGILSNPDAPQININREEVYDVILSIEEVFIKTPGINYSENDTIEVIGNKGAILDFKVNKFGEISEVIVLDGGLGFTEIPFISIRSETGYNFEAVPIFKIIPPEEIDILSEEKIQNIGIINVVDCVGKVNE